jgi:antitoxin YefM
MADSVSSELDQLRRENARLIGLLEAHGIAWTPRIMVATGLLVGEGFDQPPLTQPWCMATGPMMLYRKLDSAMQVVSFSEARESFKAVLDRVEADADVTLITRRHAQGAVVMSLDTYNSLMETVHLLRSPANAAHLQRSLEQAERGELLAHPLIDAGS